MTRTRSLFLVTIIVPTPLLQIYCKNFEKLILVETPMNLPEYAADSIQSCYYTVHYIVLQSLCCNFSPMLLLKLFICTSICYYIVIVICIFSNHAALLNPKIIIIIILL